MSSDIIDVLSIYAPYSPSILSSVLKILGSIVLEINFTHTLYLSFSIFAIAIDTRESNASGGTKN